MTWKVLSVSDVQVLVFLAGLLTATSEPYLRYYNLNKNDKLTQLPNRYSIHNIQHMAILTHKYTS